MLVAVPTKDADDDQEHEVAHCAVNGLLELCLWPRQKNYSDRGGADQSNDENVVAMSDEAEPAKGVADVGVAAMRTANSEPTSAPCARALPAEQGIW